MTRIDVVSGTRSHSTESSTATLRKRDLNEPEQGTRVLRADVLGVDIASNLVEAGNKRAKEQGLANCRFQEGDASNLSDLDGKSLTWW